MPVAYWTWPCEWRTGIFKLTHPSGLLSPSLASPPTHPLKLALLRCSYSLVGMSFCYIIRPRLLASSLTPFFWHLLSSLLADFICWSSESHPACAHSFPLCLHQLDPAWWMLSAIPQEMRSLFALEISLLKKWSFRDFPGSPVNAGDMGSIPGPGRSHMPWSN